MADSAAAFIHLCGPNEAIVQTGFGIPGGMQVVVGGVCWAVPCLHEIRRLDLTVMTVEVNSSNVVSSDGVPMNVRAVAQCRIDPGFGGDPPARRQSEQQMVGAGDPSESRQLRSAGSSAGPVLDDDGGGGGDGGEGVEMTRLGADTAGEMEGAAAPPRPPQMQSGGGGAGPSEFHLVKIAAQQFAGQPKEVMVEAMSETLEGAQRGIMSALTTEQLYADRVAFMDASRSKAEPELLKMGIRLMSYTLLSVTDDNGFLDSLGQRRLAEVQREAQVGEDRANSEKQQKMDFAHREMKEATNKVSEAISAYKQDFQSIKSELERDVLQQQQAASSAYIIVAATEDSIIADERGKVNVVKTQKQSEMSVLEVERKKRALQANQFLVADAGRVEQEILAEAAARETEINADADATAIKVDGNATAAVIEAKGQAESAVMEAQAVAYKKFGQSAYLDLMVNQLPQLAGAMAAPLAQTQKTVIMGTGESGLGFSQITREVVSISAQLPVAIKTLTGLEFAEQLATMDQAVLADTGPGGPPGIEA